MAILLPFSGPDQGEVDGGDAHWDTRDLSGMEGTMGVQKKKLVPSGNLRF